MRQGYGIIRDDSSDLIFTHRGHLYETLARSSVRAVFDGKVAFVGPVAGYGTTLILDHGDHYYSVYSYIDKANVTLGDQVRENQSIAVSGEIDQLKTNGIYFEIRHFSEPADPKQWVKGT